MNNIFEQLRDNLLLYMKKMNQIQIYPLRTVNNFIACNTPVITFNYTNIIENYSNNPYYIHGSVNEEHIVLGYKDRNEPSGGSNESTEFAKSKLREKLNFYRYLVQKDLSKTKILEEMKNFEEHVETLFSGRGGYNFNPKSEFKDFKDTIYSKTIFSEKPYTVKVDNKSRKERLKEVSSNINEYGESNNFSPAAIDTGIDFSIIENLVILGHSLQADEEIFEHLFKELTRLNQIVLFTYDEECHEQFEEKKRFLKYYSACPIIVKKY